MHAWCFVLHTHVLFSRKIKLHLRALRGNYLHRKLNGLFLFLCSKFTSAENDNIITYLDRNLLSLFSQNWRPTCLFVLWKETKVLIGPILGIGKIRTRICPKICRIRGLWQNVGTVPHHIALGKIQYRTNENYRTLPNMFPFVAEL